MDLKEKKISSKIAYNGKFLNVSYDEVICPNGNKSSREVVRHPGASAIIARIDDKYILERQYRYAIDSETLEIPAGKRDKGESFEDTAKRELEEETGYRSLNFKHLGNIFTSVGFCDEEIAIYLADDLVRTKTNFDTDEIILLEMYTLSEIKEMIKNGIIKDAKTIAAFGYLIMNGE